jgi:predicted MFS family arabinose efflux permease
LLLALSLRLIDVVGSDRLGTAALACMFASLALLPLGRGSLAATALILVPWALGSFAMTSTQQVRLIGYNPALAPVTVGLSSAGFAMGNVSGTLLGGAALTVVSLSSLASLSAAVMAIAIALHFRGMTLDRRHRRAS